MIALAKRNLKLYFRDKASVFFSLLGVLITIGLYILFLGDLMRQNVAQMGLSHGRFLMDSWIMAGIIAVASLTTTLGAFGTMVEDKSKKIIKDFSASPIKRVSLAGGYILSAISIGIIMCTVALVFAEIYIVVSGGSILPFIGFIKVFGCMILSVLASSSIVFLIASFIKSQNAFGAISTVIGSLMGFLMGIYIPIGTLPPAIQTVIKIFPISHAAVLLRQTMMEVPMKEIFSGAPENIVSDFGKSNGIIFTFDGMQMTWIMHVLILLSTAILFYTLAMINISRKSK